MVRRTNLKVIIQILEVRITRKSPESSVVKLYLKYSLFVPVTFVRLLDRSRKPPHLVSDLIVIFGFTKFHRVHKMFCLREAKFLSLLFRVLCQVLFTLDLRLSHFIIRTEIFSKKRCMT